MDQKDVDSLFSQGSIAEFKQKEDELIKNISNKEKRDEVARRGKVIGQLSKVSEESEAGTNVVMGYLENVLAVISKQQSFIKDIFGKYKENATTINFDEVLSFLDDNNTIMEDLIFSAMDAFQFQDIGRQKLMKVMYTLARLNDYLNELLGEEENKEKSFGHQIEKRTLEKDKDKKLVDTIIDTYKTNEAGEIRSTPPFSAPPPAPKVNPVNTAPSVVSNNADVDSIIAEFQKKNKSL